MTFEEWMQHVDEHLVRMCGCISSDLPEFLYRDAYDNGEDPEDVAAQVVEKELL